MAEFMKEQTDAPTPKSFSRKILLPMLSILVLIAFSFTGALLFGGTTKHLNSNLYQLFAQRVDSQAKAFMSDVTTQLINLDDLANDINSIVRDAAEEAGLSPADLAFGSDFALDVLQKAAGPMYSSLHNHPAGAVFVVFTGAEGVPQSTDVPLAGLMLRPLDETTSPESYSDIVFERSPEGMAGVDGHGVSRSASWQPSFRLEGTSAQNEYLLAPLRAAAEYPEATAKQLAYWNEASNLNPGAEQAHVLSYTLPLMLENGRPYGVVGVDLGTRHLEEIMPYQELQKDGDGSFLFGWLDGNGIETTVHTGPLYHQIADGDPQFLLLDEALYDDIYRVENGGQTAVYACVKPLQVHLPGSPYSGRQWVLAGLVEPSALSEYNSELISSFFLALALSMIIGFAGIFLVSRIFTRPVTDLANSVSAADPGAPIELKRSGIIELDSLAQAIEVMSGDVANSASKLSLIIGMTRVPIAAFEYHRGGSTVSFTRHFFRIFGRPTPEGFENSETGVIPREDFEIFMAGLEDSLEYEDAEHSVRMYRIVKDILAEDLVYIRLRTQEMEGQLLGVAEDVTQDILEQKRLEFERDYDLLTNLFNSRAFQDGVETILADTGKAKTAAMLMLDLDNLKYINDTYGHDTGDKYIRSAADVIRSHTPENAVVSRMSGDEFFVFLYGFDGKEDARNAIHHLREGIRSGMFQLPDGGMYRLRASAGLTWYPDDTADFATLMRYADFAMYQVKNTSKGEFGEFNETAYMRSSYLLHGKEELNKLIDGRLIDYMFQPIVDAGTGTVFAYEALMRSHLESLRSPVEILALARSQSKLYQIERLTWFTALSSFSTQMNVPANCKLFINSIASQCMSDKDMNLFAALHHQYLHRIVVEMLEEERQEDEATNRKLSYIKKWNAQVALDDYGTGYNGDVLLLSLSPDYIKIDMSLVRNIHIDPDRQKLLRNMISYAGDRGIMVIAEGVECLEEMQTLIAMGVDYLQGYYLARPAYELPQIPQKVLEEICHCNEEYTAENTEFRNPFL